MKPWQRLAYYLAINIVVSALTTWTVLAIWDRSHPRQAVVATAATQAPVAQTSSPGSEAATPAAPTATPLDNVEEYQVQANDTMGDIAARFGVSVEELMAVNGLNDPDSLSAGMVLYIPITPEVETTEEPTATSATSAPAGSTTPAAEATGGVTINSVIGAGDLASERVFISRTGSGVLLLADWKLMDENGYVFVFPTLELFEGGAVNVWTTNGSPTVVDLYWGLGTAVWQSGERATLLDAQGNVQAVYQVP